MPVVEYWIVASKEALNVYITKGKRYSETLASALNKVNRLTNKEEIFLCERLEIYFHSHAVPKYKLVFCNVPNYSERAIILKSIYSPKGSYEI